ncbi:MAG: hypothetical protein ABI389_06920 [Rhodanobacter sp.]
MQKIINRVASGLIVAAALTGDVLQARAEDSRICSDYLSVRALFGVARRARQQSAGLCVATWPLRVPSAADRDTD